MTGATSGKTKTSIPEKPSLAQNQRMFGVAFGLALHMFHRTSINMRSQCPAIFLSYSSLPQMFLGSCFGTGNSLQQFNTFGGTSFAERGLATIVYTSLLTNANTANGTANKTLH